MPGEEPRSVFVTVNGLSLHHLDWGNPDAPALLLVHGLSGNAHNFDATARRFSDRFHVIAVDVRGRGDSAWSPNGAYDFEDYVADLEGVVDALGLDRFTLAGTSMGNRISMLYASLHPEKLTGLIVNDIGPDAEPGFELIRQNQTNVPPSFADLDEAIAYRGRTSAVFAAHPYETQLERFQHDLKQGDDGRFYWKHDPEWQRQRFEVPLPDFGHLWDFLRRFDAPTLVVWGMRSDILSERQARRMVEVLPQGELVSVSGVGHAPTLEEPEAIARLEPFLAARAGLSSELPTSNTR